MDKHKSASYHDLREALQEPGCPVCRLALRVVARYLDNLLYENVNDPGVRHAIREARGFCNVHAWELQKLGGALGIAIIHRDILETLVRILEAGRYRAPHLLSPRRMQAMLNGDPSHSATTEVVTALSSQAPCPACRHRQEMEDIYLHTLLEHLSDPEWEALYRASAGLCLPHFRRALEVVSDERIYRILVQAQRYIWRHLIDELGEVIRKHDYRYIDEPWGTERDAWIRAIAQVVGQPGVR